MTTNAMHAVCEGTKRNSHTGLTDAGFDGKILAHHAKAGYDYPTIHLPVAFSGLIGLRTRIYQTVHDGALAFLVVVSSACTPSPSKPANHKNAIVSAVPLAFTRRRSGVQIASSPSVFVILLRIHRSSALRTSCLLVGNFRSLAVADYLSVSAR